MLHTRLMNLLVHANRPCTTLTVDGYKALLEAAGVKTWGGETAEDVDAVAAESGTETAPGAVETTAPASDGQVAGKLLVSDDGSTRDKNGDPISITGVASVKDGKLVLMTESGTIDVKDVQFANEDVANVYDAISQMDVTPEAAWELVSTYKHSDGISSEDFASDIQLAYRYGRKNFKNGLKNLKLTKEQADTAFRLGRKAAEAAVKTTKRAVSDGTVSDNNLGKKILFEGFTYSEQTANDVQKASMEAIDTINKLSSLEVHVFKSYKKKDGKLYALVDGKERLAPNGYFTDGNKIYIDLNAGNMGEGVMLYTMAHEIGHYIAQWNAEDFQAISDFLFAHYGEDVPIYDLLETQKTKLRESYKRDGKAIPSEAQLEKLAHEELVCDMLSRMLADKNVYDKLIELKQKDLNLFQKLGRAIKKLLDKLAKVIGIYDKYTPDFKYAASVETFGEEAFRQLQDLYIKAFVQADANFQAAEKKHYRFRIYSL